MQSEREYMGERPPVRRWTPPRRFLLAALIVLFAAGLEHVLIVLLGLAIVLAISWARSPRV